MRRGRARILVRLLAACGGSLAALAAFVPAVAGEVAVGWPQFRGPDRDGVSRETMLHVWPDDGPATLWRTTLGEGFSGLSVVGGRVYTMFAKGDDEYVVCLDARDGREIWLYRIDAKWRDRFGNGPRSTPTVESGRVFALSGRGTLVALQAEDGTELWKRDLGQAFGAEPPTWGFATSPLVDGDRLVVDVGGKNGASIVALDKTNGAELWRSQSGKPGYSAPVSMTLDGSRQIVVFTGTNVSALSPEDGKAYWRLPWKTAWDVNAATPVYVAPDKVFVSSGYDVGAALLRVDVTESGASVEEVWQTREMKNQFSSSVLHGGYLYGFDDKTLRCIDVTDGQTRWKTRGFGHGSLLYADGHLIVLGERGTLALVEATPDGYREKRRARPFDGKTWTVPTLVGGRLFLRDEREILALAVGR